MSTNYYSQLEQRRGPQPSEQMLQSIARGMHMNIDERDHLFRLAGHNAPTRVYRSDHINPGLMRIIDRLQETPAQVVSSIGETLVQTPLAVALFGDETQFTGLARSVIYRWFTDPASRRIFPVEDHPVRSQSFAADLRSRYSLHGAGSRAALIVDDLLNSSEEFATLWSQHEVGGTHDHVKCIVNPEVLR